MLGFGFGIVLFICEILDKVLMFLVFFLGILLIFRNDCYMYVSRFVGLLCAGYFGKEERFGFDFSFII